jgi:hypothetical protein
MKNFATFNGSVVKQCQLFSGSISMKHYITVSRMNFLRKTLQIDNTILQTFSKSSIASEIESLALGYNDKFRYDVYTSVMDQFVEECNH